MCDLLDSNQCNRKQSSLPFLPDVILVWIQLIDQINSFNSFIHCIYAWFFLSIICVVAIDYNLINSSARESLFMFDFFISLIILDYQLFIILKTCIHNMEILTPLSKQCLTQVIIFPVLIVVIFIISNGVARNGNSDKK